MKYLMSNDTWFATHPGPSVPSWWKPRYEVCAWCGGKLNEKPCDTKSHQDAIKEKAQ